MNITDLAIMNTWCDIVANDTRKTNITNPDANIFSNEKWALFFTALILHKITGQLDDAIIGQKHQKGLLQYTWKKHNLSPEKLEQINCDSLQQYLQSQSVHQHASIMKVMHRCIPTQVFLNTRHRMTSKTWQRCKNVMKTFFISSNVTKKKTACTFCQDAMYHSLNEMVKVNTNIYILHSLEEVG
jgi:hypothetical protein